MFDPVVTHNHFPPVPTGFEWLHPRNCTLFIVSTFDIEGIYKMLYTGTFKGRRIFTNPRDLKVMDDGFRAVVSFDEQLDFDSIVDLLKILESGCLLTLTSRDDFEGQIFVGIYKNSFEHSKISEFIAYYESQPERIQHYEVVNLLNTLYWERGQMLKLKGDYVFLEADYERATQKLRAVLLDNSRLRSSHAEHVIEAMTRINALKTENEEAVTQINKLKMENEDLRSHFLGKRNRDSETSPQQKSQKVSTDDLRSL